MIRVWADDKKSHTYPDADSWAVDQNNRLGIIQGEEMITVYKEFEWKRAVKYVEHSEVNR